jgi:four helix bundle protein
MDRCGNYLDMLQVSRVSDFNKLVLWQKAHALALHTYRVAKGIRHSTDVALRSQIIRAAMSIPANIVEGRRQSSEKEFARFLGIAINSAYELEYHVLIARDIELVSKADASNILEQLSEVRRMLHGLQAKASPPTKPSKRLSA